MNDFLALGVAVLLVFACGGFVAAEFALVTVDRAEVDRVAGAGDRRAKGTLRALRTLSTQLSGAQLGITITNLAIGFLAEPAISRLIDGPLISAGVPARAVPGVALVLGLAAATAVTMIFGELVPKNLALARPLRVAGATQGYQRGFTTSMAYPIRVLNGAANAIVRALGVEPQEELRSARSARELSSLVRRSAQEGVLERRTARLLERALGFSERTAADIMTPRMRVLFLDGDAPVWSVIEAARSTGHSRFPVAGTGHDDVIGIVHIKQAVAVPVEERDRRTVAEIAAAPALVPHTLELDPLLALLRGHGMQMAVVIDEYGGTHGVVTMEDLVEEIVGDISDEHDTADDAQATSLPGGEWSLSGLLRPDEVADLTGVVLPEGENYETVAGLMLERLGRVPGVGDTVEIDLGAGAAADDSDGPESTAEIALLTVARMDERRVDRISLTVSTPEDPADPDAPGDAPERDAPGGGEAAERGSRGPGHGGHGSPASPNGSVAP